MHHAEPGRATALPVDVWLVRLLRDGPVTTSEIEAAAKDYGVSMKTCERTKKKLGVKAVRQGKGWAWCLAQGCHDVLDVAQAKNQDSQHSAESAPPSEQPASAGPTRMPMVRSRYVQPGAVPVQLVPLCQVMGRKLGAR